MVPNPPTPSSIHPSAQKGYSANLAKTFSEVRVREGPRYLPISYEIHPEFIVGCLDKGANVRARGCAMTKRLKGGCRGSVAKWFL
jgi:hypothetical protein